MTRDIERRDFLALCGLGVLGAQTVMDGASEPAEDSEPVALKRWADKDSVLISDTIEYYQQQQLRNLRADAHAARAFGRPTP